jgi:hypothetical protein
MVGLLAEAVGAHAAIPAKVLFGDSFSLSAEAE